MKDQNCFSQSLLRA